MAVFHCEFFSKSLCRNVRFTAVIPNDVPPMVLGMNFEFKRPAKTIYLLHGFSENESGWLYYGHLVELAGKYKMTPGFTDPIANYEYYKMVFGGEDGDVKKVADTDYNPEHLIIGLQKENKRIPGLYLAIGTEDFLYNENQIFKKFLEEHEVPFKYSEGPGSHNFDFWNQHIEPAIRWMLDEE